MAENSFSNRIGIKRNVIKKDLLYFFIPWITVMIIEAQFIVRDLSNQPQGLFSSPVESIIGLTLSIIGFTIMLVGQITLWKNYSSFVVIHKDHRLITYGIYRFTRNPMYLGGLMVFFGLPIFAASLYGFLTSLVMIPILLYRIRLEEGLLTEEFQDAFQEYKKTTKKLIPYIY